MKRCFSEVPVFDLIAEAERLAITFGIFLLRKDKKAEVGT